ncbi:MAG: FKBP-type peptidyl-prolyl cis-trans isomerase, partial [Chlamydiia bacterium]|nr:FKBP-type peptidyl-prolyl cis-trans isomerase [Chlamydiia bacterium]
EKPDLAKLSEAFGHMIGQNLDSLGFDFDMDQVLKGLKDSIAGIESPLSEAETVQAITAIQEEEFKNQSDKNLVAAEDFLASNAQNKDVIEIEEQKLQYKILEEGTGAEVQPHFSPLIRYTGRFIDGKEFGASQEDEPIALDETIPGFSKGLIGMKEGEKRTLYIHPDLGYGMQGFLPPNSLLVFDIELVKANAPQTEETLSTNPSESGSDEIALPDFDEHQLPAVR